MIKFPPRKFKIGDQVKITGGSWEGKEGFIVENCAIDPQQITVPGYQYYVSIPDKECSCSIRESILEPREETLFERVELGLDGSDINISEYMEGVINHMRDAGIDPTNNNPRNYIFFQEMAGRISKDKTGKCNLIIAVGDRERNIPHFHVFRSEEDLYAWKNGACLFFTGNCYYDHSNNKNTLTKNEIEQLVKRLNEVHTIHNISNWEMLIIFWNNSNDMYKIPEDTPMPEYDYKTITRYEEHKKGRLIDD